MGTLTIGLDLGTTALKAALFDDECTLMGVSTQEYGLLTPGPSRVEADVNVYWTAFKDSLADLRTRVGFRSDDVRALGISAQGETLFFMDQSGKPLRNAIVWLDNRASLEAAELAEKFSNKTCYQRTGQVSFEPCWPASKVLWVRRNEPEVFRSTSKIVLIADYFIHKMTGVYAAEGSLLCSTVYWDIIRKTYWPEMIDFLGLKETQLPGLSESGDPVATLRPEVARELDLSVKTVVCTGALDQVAGAIGAGNIAEGSFSENTGAALAVCAPVSRATFDPNGVVPLHVFVPSDMYMMHTFTTGGLTLRWFRDVFCNEESALARALNEDAYGIMSREAQQVPAGSDGLLMLPHLAGSLAPDVNAKARGVFFGLSLRHRKPHFVRAIMESIGYVIRRNLEALQAMGIEVNEIRSLGGGSRSDTWNQMKADITGKPVLTLRSGEAACLGAAILAARGTGRFRSVKDAVARVVRVQRTYTPDPANRGTYEAGFRLYKKLFASLADVFDEASRPDTASGPA